MSRPVPRRAVLGGAVVGAASVVIGAPAANASQTDADLSFPATRVARQAHKLVTDTQQPFLRNHSLRSFLFARAAAGQQGKRPNEDYDLEVVYLICVLHDMGLTDEGNTDQRFELAGADLAARFLEEHGRRARSAGPDGSARTVQDLHRPGEIEQHHALTHHNHDIAPVLISHNPKSHQETKGPQGQPTHRSGQPPHHNTRANQPPPHPNTRRNDNASVSLMFRDAQGVTCEIGDVESESVCGRHAR
ncbi:hypothetical protein [Streptomyces sp. uw30]|uniref:hypothetical protein n=1 Tax=Streptomyces sp. uw30 TaxID=1828179 RepID=UPI0016518DD5|nr:hypothetical protein [Streptomyces sp. uw30]